MSDSTTTPGTDGHSSIVLEQVGRYESGQFNEDAAEIITHSARTGHLYVVNADVGGIDVLDVTSPDTPERVDRLILADVWDDAGEVTNIALREDVPLERPEAATSAEDGGATSVLAVATVAATSQENGRVVFYDAAEHTPLTTVEVGAVPDMVTFAPDGETVLTADSGEPSEDYTTDPPGTVSLIDIGDGIENATVESVDFTAYDGREDELRERGVRVFGPDASASVDLEPEYLTVSADSTTAYVVLQVNNAFAVVDIETATVTDIHPFGYKDHDATGNELDASDVDRLTVRNWPIYGMYQPDAITSYEVDSEASGDASGSRTESGDDETYLVTANEGGMRDYEGFSEVTTVGELALDRDAFDLENVSGVETIEDLQRPENLGNLLTTTHLGDIDGDGRHEDIYAFGGRSFAIWRTDGTLVADSGADFELLTAMHHPEYFNTDGLRNTPYSQSTVKGPEPEGVDVGRIGDCVYAFVGLERIASLVVYDITEPTDPSFVQYINNRNFEVDPLADVEDGEADVSDAGDLGPEGVTFIPAADSPVDEPVVAVGNELSGTTTLYRVRTLAETGSSTESEDEDRR
ncbi:choice-of-anchor I family protein [Halococcus sp. AFM35]|uniref:choice-of-anchor I family protein n=1 Tax=Halococcus sp. AFM35 TaxID=3421653 RepID=UPI003EC078B6